MHPPPNPIIESDGVLLTPKEAAAKLRFNPDTLKNWRCTGAVDIPFVKLSGRIFYRRSVIHDAMLRTWSGTTSRFL